MSVNTRTVYLSYSSFIKELNTLLKASGIAPSHFPVLAGNEHPENLLLPSVKEKDPQVGRVIIYMEEHLCEEMNLDELAGKAGLSKFQLIRKFREEEGTTPWKFLIGRRIERVKELLEDGTSPAQAALEAGFYDQSHLTKIFRDETGLTPKAYQERNFRNRN